MLRGPDDKNQEVIGHLPVESNNNKLLAKVLSDTLMITDTMRLMSLLRVISSNTDWNASQIT